VAGDLRAIVSSIQIVADVDRMGALALHVAKIASAVTRSTPCPKRSTATSPKWAGSPWIWATARRSAGHPGSGEAARIREEDDRWTTCTATIQRVDGPGVEARVTAAVDVTLLSRFYERFADHAVEVARRIIFQVTGQFPEEEDVPTPVEGSGPEHQLAAVCRASSIVACRTSSRANVPAIGTSSCPAAISSASSASIAVLPSALPAP